MPRKNLLSLFDEFSRLSGEVAVVQKRGYRREKLTYAEVHSSALFWSHALAERGVEPGDRVLLWGPNSGEWAACFWGILLRGAIVVPMDAAASADFVQRAIQDAGVKLILRDRQQSELSGAPPSLIINDLAGCEKTREDCHSERREESASVKFPGEKQIPRAETALGMTSGASFAAQLEGDREAQGLSADAKVGPGDAATRSTIAEIVYTSGTTAEPRGVVLTHGNFLANLEPLERGIEEYRNYERWFHPLRFVTLVPLSHVFGQFMGLLVPPLLGAAVVFEPSSTSSEIVRTIQKERATALIAVPRMLDLLKAGMELEFESRGKLRWLNRKLEKANGQKFLRRVWMLRSIHRSLGWKFWAFISGGASLSQATEDFFKRMGYAVVQGYGMTETASLISLNHPFRSTQGSIGKVLPGREFKLAEDGEILVRGENVSAGYWEQGALRRADEQGWLRTGDLAELDGEGNLRFRGRKKNVIVTPAGLNVYPEDLEAALHKQNGVRDCVVIPFERDGNAEAFAVLMMTSDREADAQAAVESANTRLAEYQRIGRWLIWPEPDFPRTATGKPRLRVIAERVGELLRSQPGENQQGLKPPGSGTSSVLGSLLARLKLSAEGTDHLEKELNLSSLDRVELISAMEEVFHVEQSEAAFANARTVADLEKLLQQPVTHYKKYIYPRWAQREPVRWLRLAVYYALVLPATQILAHPKIVGREHLQSLRGPVLMVSNHVTRRADIGLILAALPMRFRHRLATAMGGETLLEMKQPPLDWFFAKRWAYQLGYWLVIALFNVFPLPRLSEFRESFRFAGESADRGYSVLVFPEGIVNDRETEDMAPFQSGVGLLAENLGIPIVPMRLDGVWKMKRERRRFARLGEIKVRIGAPVTFPQGTSPEEVARQLQSLVRSL